MSIVDFRRRLDRIEAGRSIGPPTAILTDRPIGDLAGDIEAADAVVNWQAWVAQGRAAIRNGVLSLIRPEMTEQEWIIHHVTEH